MILRPMSRRQVNNSSSASECSMPVTMANPAMDFNSAFLACFRNAGFGTFPPLIHSMHNFCTILLLILGACTASAQGLVTFQNFVQFTTFDPSGGNRLVYKLDSSP